MSASTRSLRISPYLYLVPAFTTIMVFTIFPIFYSFYLSLLDWNMISQKVFVGFRNYVDLFTDGMFWKSVFNTFYFVIMYVPVKITLGLAFATLLFKKIRGLGFYRVGYYLPVITSLNAAAIMWLWLYNEKFGILNYVLMQLNIQPQNWLGSPRWAMLSIAVMSVWKSVGYDILLFLTGLSNIDKTYYEAADIDGASEISKFFNITIPLLSPVIFFVMVTSIIFSFQIFTQVYTMTPGGGPLKSTSVIVYYIYEMAFVHFRMGYASSLAYILFIFLLTVTLLQRKFVGSKVF